MTTEREKIIQLARECGITHNTWDEHDNQGTIAFYHAAQAEAFEAVIENMNPKHFITGAMYQSTIAAIREMAKEMK